MLTVLLQAGRPSRAWWGAAGPGHELGRTRASSCGPRSSAANADQRRAADAPQGPAPRPPSSPGWKTLASVSARQGPRRSDTRRPRPPRHARPRASLTCGLSHICYGTLYFIYSSYNPWGGSRAFLSVLSRKEIRAQSNLAPDPERYFTFLFKTHLSQGAGPGEVGSLRASLWDLVKTQAPMRRIWGAARDSAFLTSTQVTPGGRLRELPELSRAGIPQEAK